MTPATHAILEDAEIRDEATSKKYYDLGVKAEEVGDRLKAVEAYEAAYAADPDNATVCFRLAYNLDLMGEVIGGGGLGGGVGHLIPRSSPRKRGPRCFIEGRSGLQKKAWVPAFAGMSGLD